MYSLYYKYETLGYTYTMLIFFKLFNTFCSCSLLVHESRRCLMKNLEMDKSAQRQTFAQISDGAHDFFKKNPKNL